MYAAGNVGQRFAQEMNVNRSAYLTGLLVTVALLGCSPKHSSHPTADSGPEPDSGAPDASHKVDGGSPCQVACGACEQPVTIQVGGLSGTPVDHWTAHVTGNGVNCTATSSFDSCVSTLRAGTYQIAVVVRQVQVAEQSFTIEASHAPAGACCDCGYIPAHVDIRFEVLCGAPSQEEDGGVDAGTADGGWC